MRQKELKLENWWVTYDGYFQIITTLFRITIIDDWRAGYCRSTCPSNHHHKIALLDFVLEMLLLDMLANDFKRIKR